MSVPASDLAWCQVHFSMMADRGIWGVPRSGLVFQRQGDELVLITRMPWTSELAEAAAAGREVPEDEAALVRYQDADFELIRARFELAGIPCRSGVSS